MRKGGEGEEVREEGGKGGSPEEARSGEREARIRESETR